MKYSRIQRKRWKKYWLVRQWVEQEFKKLGYVYSSSDEEYWYLSNEDDITIRVSFGKKLVGKYQDTWDIDDNLVECPIDFTKKEIEILCKYLKVGGI